MYYAIITEIRRKNRKTKIIVMKLEDCMVYKKYSPEFWDEQLNSDPEKSIHSKEDFGGGYLFLKYQINRE